MSDMNLEENRLQTFHSWPSNAPIDPERLSRGGFYATGNYMETQCNWCHKKISDWQYGDQTMIRHRRLDPLCPFVLNPTNSGNVPITSSSANSIDTQSQDDTTPQNDLKNEQCRLATFTNWPNPNISPQSLAKAGFYYFNKSDQVKCAWCNGIIAKWERNDNAFDEHQRFFPNCPRVQLGPLIEIASDGIRDLGIQQIKPARKSKYSSLDARLRTYTRWPRIDIQKPDILAQAGFYYQDIADQVRCFHCNGGLRSWQKEDDPWFEHAKWFPDCQFVQLVKGQAYITEVQACERPTRDVSFHDNNVTAATTTLVSNIEQQENLMTLDEAMLTEPVQMALQMGLNEGRVRNITRRHLEFYKKPYDTPEELVEAVLDGQADEENDRDTEDDDQNEQSSSIVREVSRILNNIFNPRTSNGLDDDIEDIRTSDIDINYDINSITNERQHYDRQTTSNTASNQLNVVPDNNGHLNTILNTQLSNETNEISTNDMNIVDENNEASGTDIVSGKPELKKQISLEEENRKLKDARLCKVCMDEEVGVVFLPCGHLVTCVQCAPGVTMCPLCRSAIKGFVRTFLS